MIYGSKVGPVSADATANNELAYSVSVVDGTHLPNAKADFVSYVIKNKEVKSAN